MHRLALLAVLLLAPALSRAQGAGNHHLVGSPSTITVNDVETAVAFRFVADRNLKPNAGLIYVDGFESAQTGTFFSTYKVGIQAEAGGKPSGTFLGSAGNFNGTGTGWDKVTLSATLASGTAYYLVVEVNNYKGASGIKVRVTSPANDRAPTTSLPAGRALQVKGATGWAARSNTGVFEVLTAEDDLWAAAGVCTADPAKRIGVVGDPWLDQAAVSLAGSREVAQRFFAEAPASYDQVEVLLKNAPATVKFELSGDNLTTVAGTLTPTTSTAVGGTWYSASVPVGIKLEDGTPPLTARYYLRLKTSGSYAWLGAATDDPTDASTTNPCSTQVRSTYCGYQGRTYVYDSAAITELNGTDLFFRLRKCTTSRFYRDTDGDGFGVATDFQDACAPPPGYVKDPGDCDDSNPTASPAGTEACNGVDDNCDGKIDEGNPGSGGICSTGKKGPCSQGQLTCTKGVPTCLETVSPKPETCNGIDDDCDGASDNLAIADLPKCAKQSGVCAGSHKECANGGMVECSYATLPDYQAVETICDGKDNDCDGKVDNLAPGGCDDQDPCTAGSCVAGSCVQKPGNDGVACNDGSSCTSSDVCKGGLCVGTAKTTPECGIDQQRSTFTAVPDTAPADGTSVVLVSASIASSAGPPVTGDVVIACSFGTLTRAVKQGDAWVAQLTSTAAGLSRCTATAPGGVELVKTVTATFTPLSNLTLSVDPETLTLGVGESGTFTATLTGGAVPRGAELVVSDLDGVRLTAASARDTDLTFTATEGSVTLALPETGGGPLAVALTVSAAESRPRTLRLLSRQGSNALSNEKTVAVDVLDSAALGRGCGCHAAGDGLSLLPLLFAGHTLRRRRYCARQPPPEDARPHFPSRGDFRSRPEVIVDPSRPQR